MDDETKTYPVLSNVRMDGTLYAPNSENDTIKLTEKQFVSLEAVGCVGEVEECKDKDTNPPVTLTDEQRVEKIKEAIGVLDAEEHFKKDGVPKAASVNTLLDFDVSADEINAVWATIKPADAE